MKKAKLYRGGLKNLRGEMQREMLTGRPENVTHKQNFKSGAFVKNDRNAGRVQPLVAEHQNATPPPKKAGATRE